VHLLVRRHRVHITEYGGMHLETTALIVTNVIGTGVFFKARVMTCNVGSPWLVLLAYVVAGVLTLGGALTFAELSAMMPRSGGQYNFIGAAFGRVWAFVYGWMETLLDGAASIAAVAMAGFWSALLRRDGTSACSTSIGTR